VALGVWVAAGARDEPDALAGASHFIEHMAFKGTTRRSALEIARELDRLGGQANAFTSKEATCFHARVLPEHLPRAVDLLSEIVLEPAYDPAELERERAVILQEIASVEDTPEELVHVLGAEHFWSAHPLGRPVLGTRESVGRLRREELLEYMRSAYAAERVVVAAVGAFNTTELARMLEPLATALPSRSTLAPRTPPAPTPGLKLAPRELNQLHMVICAPAPPAPDPRRYTAAMLSNILGGGMSSVLFQEVRERRGLAYSVYSYLSVYCDAGMISVYIGTSPSRGPEALKVALGQMQLLAERGPTAQQLADAKDHLKGSVLLGIEHPEGAMSRLARSYLQLGRYVDVKEVIRRIESVAPGDVRALAEECLSPTHLGVTALGPGDEQALARELGV